MIGKIGGQPGTAPLRPATAKLDLSKAFEKAAEVAKPSNKPGTEKLGTDKLDKAKLDANDLWADAAAESGEEVGVAVQQDDDEATRTFERPDNHLVAFRVKQSGGGGEGTLA